jgi:hypothetical protein
MMDAKKVLVAGPTALIFSFSFKWYLVVLLVLEVFLIAYLLMNRLKK